MAMELPHQAVRNQAPIIAAALPKRGPTSLASCLAACVVSHDPLQEGSMGNALLLVGWNQPALDVPLGCLGSEEAAASWLFL